MATSPTAGWVLHLYWSWDDLGRSSTDPTQRWRKGQLSFNSYVSVSPDRERDMARQKNSTPWEERNDNRKQKTIEEGQEGKGDIAH